MPACNELQKNIFEFAAKMRKLDILIGPFVVVAAVAKVMGQTGYIRVPKDPWGSLPRQATVWGPGVDWDVGERWEREGCQGAKWRAEWVEVG